jgi:hypothetical protein
LLPEDVSYLENNLHLLGINAKTRVKFDYSEKNFKKKFKQDFKKEIDLASRELTLFLKNNLPPLSYKESRQIPVYKYRERVIAQIAVLICHTIWYDWVRIKQV